MKSLHLKRRLRNHSDEWTMLVFFYAIALVHEYCHYLVRFQNWSRITPSKLRKYHRGRIAGHSFEVILFDGILRLVQNVPRDEVTGIVLEKYDPERKLYKVDINALNTIVNFKRHLLNLFEKEELDEYAADDKLNERILYSVELDEYEPFIDLSAIKSETDANILREMKLDPKHNIILRFDDGHECYFLMSRLTN
jgi:hypothetical protein